MEQNTPIKRQNPNNLPRLYYENNPNFSLGLELSSTNSKEFRPTSNFSKFSLQESQSTIPMHDSVAYNQALFHNYPFD